MSTPQERELEARIVASNATARRVTSEGIDALIKNIQYHRFDDTTTIVCCITLANGFTVIGKSAAASPSNFREDIGQDIAYRKARESIWDFEGYLLKQRLHDGLPEDILNFNDDPAENEG